MPRKTERSFLERALEAIVGVLIVYIAQYAANDLYQLLIVLFGFAIVLHSVVSD